MPRDLAGNPQAWRCWLPAPGGARTANLGFSQSWEALLLEPRKEQGGPVPKQGGAAAKDQNGARDLGLSPNFAMSFS